MYVFKGLGKGAFAERATLLDIDGKSARAGLASSVALADWDRDGKIDLVVGNIRGEVWWLRNESKDGKLAFGAKQRVKADNETIQTNGDAGPLVADWDGDGIADLLVGSDDGSVTFFKASGASGVPTLASGVRLIAPLGEHEQEGVHVELDPKTGELALPDVKRSQTRAKIAVCDWNGDGKLDLLVGDFVSVTGPEPKLDEQQLARKTKLEADEERVDEAISNIAEQTSKQAKKELGIKDDARDSDSQQRVHERVTELLSANERYRELGKQSAAIDEELDKLRAKYATHGFVWVYLRK